MWNSTLSCTQKNKQTHIHREREPEREEHVHLHMNKCSSSVSLGWSRLINEINTRAHVVRRLYSLMTVSQPASRPTYQSQSRQCVLEG